VNIAKVITAKEIVFNIGLSPVELLIGLILRAARIQRCAGEGELIFGLTSHGPMLPERSPGCQYAVFGGFGRSPLCASRSPLRKGVGPCLNCDWQQIKFRLHVCPLKGKN
jgi:hypothetical protein